MLLVPFDFLDGIFYLTALLGLFGLGIFMGITGCNTESGLGYIIILPIMTMVGIYSWKLGKKIKVGLKK